MSKHEQAWTAPKGLGYHIGATAPECGRILLDPTGRIEKAGATNTGGCSTGCCDDYRCDHCGHKWRIEWPD